MRKLIASKAVRYGKTTYATGETFEAKPSDAKILVGMRMAEYADEEPEQPTTRRRGNYRRRDMRAVA